MDGILSISVKRGKVLFLDHTIGLNCMVCFRPIVPIGTIGISSYAESEQLKEGSRKALNETFKKQHSNPAWQAFKVLSGSATTAAGYMRNFILFILQIMGYKHRHGAH